MTGPCYVLLIKAIWVLNWIVWNAQRGCRDSERKRDLEKESCWYNCKYLFWRLLHSQQSVHYCLLFEDSSPAWLLKDARTAGWLQYYIPCFVSNMHAKVKWCNFISPLLTLLLPWVCQWVPAVLWLSLPHFSLILWYAYFVANGIPGCKLTTKMFHCSLPIIMYLTRFTRL